MFGREVFVTRGCALARGVQLHSPCHISGETRIGADTKILPGCCIAGARIGGGCTVTNSRICGSKIGDGCTVGPFCNVREGCFVGNGCRLGDFVELKNAALGEGCKASHLSYIGDAELGARVNVGCGVVFANYDGQKKERTYVGDKAFIGCNSVIIAPARIGDGAYIAAGSVVSGEIPPQSLAISRPPLYVKPHGADGRYLND